MDRERKGMLNDRSVLQLANGQIYIKDVRSSNGTFVNGERLSAEGAESHPEELKNEDLVASSALAH